MREILFRGKAIVKNGDWVYGFLERKVDCCGSMWIMHCPAENPDDYYSVWEIDPETVGQFTGLSDKNGVKIYEGDIVEFEDAVADYEGYHDNIFLNRSAIEYIDGSFTVCGTQVVRMIDLVYKGELDGTVIGNIYDNPELLEVKSNV